MRLAWRRIRQRIFAGVRADGYDDLNPAHIALFRFEGLHNRRPTQLAEQMDVTKQSINDLLRHLEGLGYVELKPDPADRRARLVRLTRRGRRLESTVRAHARAAEEDLVRHLGDKRFRALRETLEVIAGLHDAPGVSQQDR